MYGSGGGGRVSASLRGAGPIERDFDESEDQALGRQLRQHEGAAALFAALDVNQSGEVDLVEAKRSLPALGWQIGSEQYLEGLWRVYDIDGSGALSLDEFTRLLSVLRSRDERTRSQMQPSVLSTPNPLGWSSPHSPQLPTRTVHVTAARAYGQPLPGTPPRPVPARHDQAAVPYGQPLPGTPPRSVPVQHEYAAASWPTGPELDPEPSALKPRLSTQEMIDSNAPSMTEDEMTDLTYAFQAADMDGSGAIDAQEFQMMLEVMGAQITTSQVRELIRNAKVGFRAWLEASNQENRTKIQEIWDEFDEDNSGTMDIREINAVIGRLQEMGYKPTPMSSKDLAGGEMSFDEFTEWFLTIEGLPDEFSAPKEGGTGGLGRKQSNKKSPSKGSRALHRFMGPFVNLTRRVASGPKELLARSVAKSDTQATAEKSLDANIDQMMRSADENDEIIFAEYVFTMRGGALSQFLPGQWQERAADMRKLREAFGTADVDGNNQLELEELEMVIVAMNPKANIPSDDIKRVWEVLNPDDRPWITFIEYVQGMITVKHHPVLSKLLPMDVPNRFQQLSLLIDPPVNREREDMIKQKLGVLERCGVRCLEKMGRKPMERKDIRHALDQACHGQLHHLTDEQRRDINRLHQSCVFQAFSIAIVTCAIAGIWENYMVYTYGTDGDKDAYFTCPEHFADLINEGSPYFNLSLPHNPGEWNGMGFRKGYPQVLWDTNSGPGPVVTEAYRQKETCSPIALEDPPTDCSFTPGDAGSCGAAAKEGSEGCTYVPPLDPIGQCLPGTCTAYPKNVTQYLAMGGNKFMGGSWTYALDGWESECVPLQETLIRDEEVWAKFMLWNTTVVVVTVVLELLGLMLTALRSAVQVSKALDLRLTPINEERAFVAAMLVRCVFELGDSDGDVMGVDADGGDNEQGRPILITILSILWIKGRVIITDMLFKVVTDNVCNYDTATWLKPYSGAMLATMLWDSMLCHAIMKRAEVQAIGVTTSVEVFNEIMDTFCPQYEEDPASLSTHARIQILRAIGVAIVKHGSMFPTMELLLRHAVGYLDMKKHKAIAQGGIIDDQDALLRDFKLITLDESRAVLCTHMLCYVLDGSIGFGETQLWRQLLERVEECYQEERKRLLGLSAQQLREFLVMKCPDLKRAVARVPVTGTSQNDFGVPEMTELNTLLKFVPMPEKATHYNQLVAKFVCQEFRANKPVTTALLFACFDPEENKNFMARAMQPDRIVRFLLGEFSFTFMTAATADPFAICWPVD